MNKTASRECHIFIVKILNKIKSVNITVFVVPHDIFAAILPKHHCLNHVYSGPDAAMLYHNVIKIGKYIHALFKSKVMAELSILMNVKICP